MNYCSNCRQGNEDSQNYCRYCGTPLVQPQKQPNSTQPPKPYGWASPSSPLHNVANGPKSQEPQSVQPFAAVPVYQPPSPQSGQQSNLPIINQNYTGYHCPRCGTNALPIIKSKISGGGWAVLILMIFFCFPLFFIGLLMREETRVCPACLTQIG